MQRIVVVEDNDSLALVMETVLSTAHYQVHIAGSGEEALNLVQEHRPRLIFMDLELPNMDGYSTCAILKNEYPDTRVLGFSADMSPSVKRKCLAAGMDDAYDKAVEPEELIRITRQHIS
ncbi:response regulator [Roseivirga sp. BDSF3-8]|uniref:response regulator n=1 Tax=Roseivirga sp. BDSF3-8 TaxID=3241598 RepID=UPI00353202D9